MSRCLLLLWLIRKFRTRRLMRSRSRRRLLIMMYFLRLRGLILRLARILVMYLMKVRLIRRLAKALFKIPLRAPKLSWLRVDLSRFDCNLWVVVNVRIVIIVV